MVSPGITHRPRNPNPSPTPTPTHTPLPTPALTFISDHNPWPSAVGGGAGGHAYRKPIDASMAFFGFGAPPIPPTPSHILFCFFSLFRLSGLPRLSAADRCFPTPCRPTKAGLNRICFQMQFNTTELAAYLADHEAVWPEMQQALVAAGWHNYSLFYREDVHDPLHSPSPPPFFFLFLFPQLVFHPTLTGHPASLVV